MLVGHKERALFTVVSGTSTMPREPHVQNREFTEWLWLKATRSVYESVSSRFNTQGDLSSPPPHQVH